MAKRNPRHSNRAKRDAVVRRVMDEESVCWLCGRPVDMRLRGAQAVNPRTGRLALHPDAPVVDEVVPVSRGGSPYERSNCRLAHNECNRYRGARMDVDAVRAELMERRSARSGPAVRPVRSQEW